MAILCIGLLSFSSAAVNNQIIAGLSLPRRVSGSKLQYQRRSDHVGYVGSFPVLTA